MVLNEERGHGSGEKCFRMFELHAWSSDVSCHFLVEKFLFLL